MNKKPHVGKHRLYPIKYDLKGAIVDESINSNKFHGAQTYSKNSLRLEISFCNEMQSRYAFNSFNSKVEEKFSSSFVINLA